MQVFTYIDPYTRMKAQSVAQHLFLRYRKDLFVTMPENPINQQYWDRKLMEYHDKPELQEELRKQLSTYSWYNNYVEVLVPEVNEYLQKRIDYIIKDLRALKILK